ncbi:MAG: YggS family pyridoxal phosphate-dependent enzyme [Chloroflexi bacterium]|nr:YggS family pyridoxal phosphate-dependent enzyme [Chloroflexota bacterium]
MMGITERTNRVLESIAEACARAGRDPAAVTLVAVSKTQPVEAVLQAVEAGLQHFGENRVEEAEDKIPAVNRASPRPLIWHMIGHLQSRKARLVLPLFQQVHSVDSLRLAVRLSALAVEAGRTLDVLLEMNVSGEAAKYGFEAAGWQSDDEVRRRLWNEVEHILALPGLNVHGLMTMAPIVADMEQTRPVFAQLAALRGALAESFGRPLPELSMGMTDDYPVAVEEGATLVRIGRALFGEG